MDDEDIRLDKAQRKVAEASARVLRQKALVNDRQRQGRSTEGAEHFLAILETALATMRKNLDVRTECLLHVRLARWFRTLRR